MNTMQLQMTTHRMGGATYKIPVSKNQFKVRKNSFDGFDPNANPGRTPREQQELENGMRMHEEWELWVHQQEQLQQLRDSKNF